MSGRSGLIVFVMVMAGTIALGTWSLHPDAIELPQRAPTPTLPPYSGLRVNEATVSPRRFDRHVVYLLAAKPDLGRDAACEQAIEYFVDALLRREELERVAPRPTQHPLATEPGPDPERDDEPGHVTVAAMEVSSKAQADALIDEILVDSDFRYSLDPWPVREFVARVMDAASTTDVARAAPTYPLDADPSGHPDYVQELIARQYGAAAFLPFMRPDGTGVVAMVVDSPGSYLQGALQSAAARDALAHLARPEVKAALRREADIEVYVTCDGY